jgi:XTP/dITP diphosphohydrolase
VRLLVASGNRKKLVELQAMAAGLPVEVLSPAQLGVALPEVVEDGATFDANAAKKAAAFLAATGIASVADDSGLCVDALAGAPGVLSARYSGEQGAPDRDERNNEKLLRALREVPAARRGAAFHCSLALALPGAAVEHFSARWHGQIAFSPRGGHGFGYDPLFLLPAWGRTSAELTPEEKNARSHRGLAMRLLRKRLEQLVRTQP